MKIRNINVSKNLIRTISYSDIQLFVLDVIRPLEKIDYKNIAKLIYTIPIYLKEKGEIAIKERYGIIKKRNFIQKLFNLR